MLSLVMHMQLPCIHLFNSTSPNSMKDVKESRSLGGFYAGRATKQWSKDHASKLHTFWTSGAGNGEQTSDQVLVTRQGNNSKCLFSKRLLYRNNRSPKKADSKLGKGKTFTQLLHLQMKNGSRLQILGYVKHGQNEEAFKLFHCMETEDRKPEKSTFVALLKACAKKADMEEGKRIHAYAIRCGFGSDIFLGSALIYMYMKCGNLEHACEVFNKMPKQDVVLWTALISGYAQHGHNKDALNLFWKMQQEGVKPNEYTCVSALNACGCLGVLQHGRQIHAYISQRGFETNIFVGNSLIDMYAKCGSLLDASFVFDRMTQRNVVSWTLLIAGYAQHGKEKDALSLFWQMDQEGLFPDRVIFITALKACSSLADLDHGKRIHARIIKAKLTADVFLGSALIDMYAKCGSLQHARQVFDKMAARTVVSWTAMIAGYAHCGQGREALNIFWKMQQENVKLDEALFVTILKVCATLTALEQGKEIHAQIVISGFGSNIFVGSALVDMYAKSGSIAHAREVFDKFSNRDVALWNAMIAGYAQNGHSNEVLHLVECMQQEGSELDHITFVGILSACNHAGLVDKGCRYFSSMNQVYGIAPTLEHYACMVDLLSRVGNLDDAEYFVETMPTQPTAVIWKALLNSCRIHGKIEFGKRVSECLLEMEPQNAVAFVTLGSIYATFEDQN